ncbi:MAG: hypothetical protein DBX60_05080, partial [Bacillota bacterium]
LKTRGKIFAKQKDFREILEQGCGDDFGKEMQARQGARGLAVGSLLKRKCQGKTQARHRIAPQILFKGGRPFRGR